MRDWMRQGGESSRASRRMFSVVICSFLFAPLLVIGRSVFPQQLLCFQIT
jgi:hypothetical protein